jgi:hypothetical protein
MNWQTFWGGVSAIASILGVIGIYIAARQLSFQAWLEAQRIFTAEDFVELRKWIIEKDGVWDDPAADKERAKDACRKFDEFARLIPYLGFPFLGRRFALRIWADPIAKCWRSLERIVIEERDQTGAYRKWDAFEKLGRKAVTSASMEFRQRRLGA